jgi:hypothetical protein
VAGQSADQRRPPSHLDDRGQTGNFRSKRSVKMIAIYGAFYEIGRKLVQIIEYTPNRRPEIWIKNGTKCA